MVRALAFVVVRQVLSLFGLGPSPDATDVEIGALRHELLVVRRCGITAAPSAGHRDAERLPNDLADL